MRGILDGSDRDNGTVLLATGGALWVTNVIAFSLWFWLLDRGGPAARAAGHAAGRRFRVPGGRHPRSGSAGLVAAVPRLPLSRLHQLQRAQPHRHMPVTRWAKMLMLVQSSISLVIAVMIVARAVNILT